MLEVSQARRTSLLVLALVSSCWAQGGGTSDEWARRLRAYTMDRDDGVRGIQGLRALASRFGAKPYKELRGPDGTWQTERVFFRDVDTGATVVRLTNDPWADQLSYFQGNWSADGKHVVFRRRPGMWESSTATHGPMAVNSDGARLRNVFRDYPMVRKEACSPAEPKICYALSRDRKLVAFDLATGKTHHVVRDVLGCWHLKVSPDGKYLMGRSNIERGGRGLWIVSSDGKEYHEIPVPEAIHDSYQFHPSQKKVMFWYEGRYRKEGFVQCDFDGKGMTKVNVLFDWNHGDVGPDRGAHTGGYITRIQGNTWLPKEVLFAKPGVEYYDNPHHYNGYLTWWPKDQLWVYSTRILARPHISELHAFHAEPAPDGVVNRTRIAYTALRRPGCLDNPGASPDGTKVLFNSNMLGRIDAYYAVARRPEPPREAKAIGSRITWHPPGHHAEIAGYHVYRSAESGVGFVPIATTPIIATEFAVQAGQAGFYAVSAVEHSGLESGLSEEVALPGRPGAKRRVFVEAEHGRRDHRMWLAFQGLASNLHYAWMRSREGEGKTTVPAELPQMGGPCIVWARVKGEKGARFAVSAQSGSAALEAPPSARWVWVRSEGTLRLKPGKCELVLRSSTYGSAVDCLFLTDDPDFSPAAAPRVRWPRPPAVQRVLAKAASPYAVRLSWQGVETGTFCHYNVYCGAKARFVPDQSTLVASPDRGAFLDWGLKPGQDLFYRVTCVDRAGNESAPSPPAKAATPKFDRAIIQKPPAERIVFRAPRKDTYVLWLKLRKDSGRGQYITVKIGGKGGGTWTCAFDKLSDASWFTYGQWGRFRLDAGTHTLTLQNKTPHTIEQVLLTNDLSHKPEGHINTLRGW